MPTLEETIEEQEEIIESLRDYVYVLEDELDQAKYFIDKLKGELSVLYNHIDDSR